MYTAPFQVFVYGTLKPGGHYWPRFCAGKVTEVIPAQVHGELYDLHVGYPGVLLRGEAWVRGCILSFKDEADLRRLDELEGYAEGRDQRENEYNRLRVPCFSPTGEPLGEVWVYEMTETTMRRCSGTRIEDGNWPV